MSGLLDRHLAFLEALRGAGLSVSLAEDLDAVAALGALGWGSRPQVREAYAATLVKKQSVRPTFDALFDLYFPPLVGEGVRGASGPFDVSEDPGDAADPRDVDGPRDTAEDLARLREQLAEALTGDDLDRLRRLAAEAVSRFGAMPGRGPGLSSWSSYTALRRVAAEELLSRLVDGLRADGWGREEAARAAHRRLGVFTSLVESDARRRLAEEKGADHVARVTLRPSVERLDFLSARRSDLEEMRREIYPLARRLATRLSQEHHARRRGSLDFRRTVRASLSTGGVPLTTHHRPKRPHRTELVVLCDVSGSVASFAQFTLMLVFALREAFQGVRAFTFVDDVHEVTDCFRPGGDLPDTMARLAAASAHAARFGRTNYGRAFELFADRHLDALGPKSSLLVLGDARSNYADSHVETLREIAGRARRSWWLNPEHRRQWDTGDSVASAYASVVPMTECRNLTQLAAFVHDVAR